MDRVPKVALTFLPTRSAGTWLVFLHSSGEWGSVSQKSTFRISVAAALVSLMPGIVEDKSWHGVFRAAAR